jgi:hypothetical protein
VWGWVLRGCGILHQVPPGYLEEHTQGRAEVQRVHASYLLSDEYTSGRKGSADFADFVFIVLYEKRKRKLTLL